VIRAGMMKAGCGMLGQLLAADPGYRGPRVDCGHGHQAVFIAYRDKVIDTVLGPVTVTRAWYHCAACGHGIAPRDAELGAAGASMSPGLAAMTYRAAAAVPFQEAAGLLEDLAGVRLTVKRVERAAEASGAVAAAAVRERAALITARKLVPLPPDPLPDKLYAAIDGTGIPVTSKETAGREGKDEDGRARTREVKLAVFFTQDKLDKNGVPRPEPRLGKLRGRLRARRHVREPREGRGHPPGRGPRPPVHDPRRRGRLDLEDREREVSGGHPDRGPVPRPRARPRPRPQDGIHARRPQGRMARRPPRRPRLRRRRPHHRRDPQVPPYRREEGRDRHRPGLLREQRRPRMRYHWFRQCGLFVGSGLVEAGCKSVIGHRLKRAGMHWTVNGADAIAALRCQQASRPEDQIWPARRGQAKAA
jgi:hypothetical protein